MRVQMNIEHHQETDGQQQHDAGDDPQLGVGRGAAGAVGTDGVAVTDGATGVGNVGSCADRGGDCSAMT